MSNQCVTLLMLLAAFSSSHVVAQDAALTDADTAKIRGAAEQGDSRAQFVIGGWYDLGMGVVEDNSEAARWYRRSAEQGFALAQVRLGQMYDNGEGVAENDAEAVKWYRRAADQGDAAAQTNLGSMYANGEGVPKSKVDAYFWFNLAAAQGNAIAKKNKGLVEETMTREQIAEAQRKSSAWKPKERLTP